MIKNILSNLKIINSLTMAILIALTMAVYAPAVSAQAVRQTSDFNHMKTGFPLTGVHINVECETCHVGGIFKGTATDCAGCHSAGRRVVAPFKPANHIVTNTPCEVCHSSTVSFLGARFNHIGVQPKACMTCHNGGMGPGKPGGHIPTTLACDSCHRTSAWIPAGFDHMGVAPGSCTTCHGVTATGKPGGHVLTASVCDACHKTTGWIPAGYNHIGITQPCSSCHNGSTAIGKPSYHITVTAECNTCHFNFITFVGAVYNHAGVVAGTCGTCHLGQSAGAKTKTSGHIPTSGNGCDSCHKAGYTSFGGSVMDHSASVPAYRCDTCHNGSYKSEGLQFGGARAKPSDHPSTSLDCASSGCHRPGGTKGALYQSF